MVIRWRVLRVALYDAWPVWVAIVVVLAAGLLGRLLSTSLTGALRYAGTALEVAGLCTVAVGLYHTRKLFGQPTVTRRISSWLSNLARAFRRPEATTFNVEAGGYAMVGGKARLRVGAGPNTSVERRLEILERNVDQLEQEMDTEIAK